MKYRLLTLDELKELEPEFVRFLASNQITADEWVKIKQTNQHRVDQLICLFSDIVMDKVLKKIDYAEQRNTETVLFFKFAEERMILVGLNAVGHPEIDFSNPSCLKELAKHPENFNEAVSYFKTERPYIKSREEDIFSVIDAGALISDGKLFEALNLAKIDKNTES